MFDWGAVFRPHSLVAVDLSAQVVTCRSTVFWTIDNKGSGAVTSPQSMTAMVLVNAGIQVCCSSVQRACVGAGPDVIFLLMVHVLTACK